MQFSGMPESPNPPTIKVMLLSTPAIALAAINVMYRDKEAIMGVYPSDHLIIGDKHFKNSILKGKNLAQNKSALITLGVKPAYSATGYGYIQFESTKIPNYPNILKVKKFIEKPNKIDAEKYYKSDKYFWNCGIFIWKAKEILASMKIFMKEDYKNFMTIYNAIDNPEYIKILKKKWALIHNESIDFGILQKAKNVYTIYAQFKWNDLGSWKSLFDFVDKNDNGSFHSGKVITLKSSNNLIISPKKLTAVIGMKNVAIINLDDVTLITPISKSEAVKDLVAMIKSLNKLEYL